MDVWIIDRENPGEVMTVNEVSPPGWSGTVKAMKKHKEISNPWALAWWMKNKGAKPHYKPEPKKNESTMNFKEWLTSQAECINKS